MAERRNRPSYTPAELLNVTQFTPLLWPGRTVRLERNSLLDYRNRSTSAQVSVAELYHENSKLSRELLPELVADGADPAAFRREVLRRRALLARAAPGGLARAAAGDRFDGIERWRDLLGAVAADNLELFYAVEPRLVSPGPGAVLAHEPAANTFSIVKELTAAQRAELVAAVSLGPGEGERPGPEDWLVLLLACFPRNEILYGPRGYRRTLLEAGRLAEALVRAAAAAGHRTLVRYEFADDDVDRMMEADGVEHSTVAAIACS